MRRRSLNWPESIAALSALVTFTLVVIRAAATVDPNWDTLAYHWAFAARAGGLCGPECFAFPPGIEQRYEGFPLLFHTLQGLLWRVTGTPGLADLINIALVGALAAYLKWRFSVPLAWSWLAYLAIPEAQIEMTSSFLDLPLNAAVTIGLMVTLRLLVQPEADQRPDIAIGLAALALAAGSKYQMVPIALAAWIVIIVLVARRPSMIGLHRATTAVFALGIAGALLLLPKLAANWLVFGNPFYPLDVRYGPVRFPGPEDMAFANSISDWWVARPAPLRWLASVMEWDAFGGRPLAWTIGNGDVPQSYASFRMGGYFVAYVLGALTLLTWGARHAARMRFPVALMIVLSLMCAFLPSSHELRYYMFWMLALVSCVLIAGHSPLFAGPRQPLQRQLTHCLAGIACASVILMTGGAYLSMEGPVLGDLLGETLAVVAEVPEGGTLCILNRNPRSFLYASVFHPPRRYQTKSLWSDEEANCTIRVDLNERATRAASQRGP